MSITYTRITEKNDPLLIKLWPLYEFSFPVCEQRSLLQHKQTMEDPDFNCRAYFDDQKLLGLLFFWTRNNFNYLEHIALDPKLRSGGYGSKILTSFIQDSTLQTVLEMDIITDDISLRRWNFYKRLGFNINEGVHNHPSYQKGYAPHPLTVLSYGRTLEPKEYSTFIDMINNGIMAYTKEDF